MKKTKNDNKKSVCIIGNLSKGEESINGQTIKTENLIKSFRQKGYIVEVVDTFGYKRRLLKSICSLFVKVKRNTFVIMLPDFNGFRVFSLLLPFIKRKKSKIFYSVVGGWLPNYIDEHKKYIRRLKRFDGIWVENEDMKQKMESLDLHNVEVVENFKIYKDSDIKIQTFEYFAKLPNNICFLSRVDEDKGVTEAIVSVIRINETQDEKVHLDIYGPIFEGYSEKFNSLLNQANGFVTYKGLIRPEEVPIVISDYLVQLFPTKCNTEGIPGSIIDSFAAGVPVIAPKWNPNFEIIKDMETGLIIEMNSVSSLVDKIIFAINNKQLLFEMKRKCLVEYRKYNWKNVFSKMEGLMINEKNT